MRHFRVQGFPNYFVFYLPSERGIEVVRVIHRARDLRSIFGEDQAVPGTAVRSTHRQRPSPGASITMDPDAVLFHARNDHVGLTIPYEYTGSDHAYEPDFLVPLGNGTTVVLEIKGFEPDLAHAKHAAAKRWVEAVNNWGELGTWAFHVCRNPQMLGKEVEHLARATRSPNK